MSLLFEQNSFTTFFDTLCMHLKKNISSEVQLEYEIDPSLIFLRYNDAEKLSHVFLDMASTFREAFCSGTVVLYFEGVASPSGGMILTTNCDIRKGSITDIQRVESKLEALSGAKVVTCNDLAIKVEMEIVTSETLSAVNTVKEKFLGRKVLLVGDSEILNRYRRALNAIGIISVPVKSGGEAFECLFSDTSFNIVIMSEKKDGITPLKFKTLLHNNRDLKHIHLLSIADFKDMGYAPFLEKVIRYMEGVAVSESVEIQQKSDTAIFDHNKLLERTGGNSGFIRKIIALYCKDMTKYLQTLSEEGLYGDLANAQRIAHAMKGASFSCCANRMASHASELETAVKTGGIDGVPLLLDALQSAFSEFREEVTSVGYL